MFTNKFVRNLYLKQRLIKKGELSRAQPSWIIVTCNDTNSFCLITIWATVTRNNYSRWQRRQNLKTKVGDSKTYLFRIQTLSLKILQTDLTATVLSSDLKLLLL